ncbi:HD domain-containing protein [Patulibacter sp. SYSU D01012]|uniref:HD domain-containing protein n=1 Tax=Patulibacter sp. SYSU D01012 TaxID=2817381 RepID=UPI001B300EDB|nr:HD domain-containing protein [Patulibacter sp. SYSU D01012]
MAAPEGLLVDANPFPAGLTGELRRQLEFVVEVDRMKAVLRASPVASVARRENDAEHSWHLALMVLVLAQHAAEPVDVGRTLELVVVHDLVEVYAGDTVIHDPAARVGQAERELAAADRLFALLPGGQGERLRAAWEEFEAHATPEARFARSMDRLQPILQNWVTGGGSWEDHDVTPADMRARTGIIADGAPGLWAAAEVLIDEAARRGLLRPDGEDAAGGAA